MPKYPVLPYADACVAAATAQGLDPVTERLHTETVHYEVEQTGGFTMVVVVPREDGVYGITADGEDTWLVCWYRGNTWAESGEQQAYWTDQTLDQVIEIIKEGRP